MYTLTQLEQAIRDSWSLDTADPENDWSPENPSCGQCDVTSLVVHDLLGGELLGADVYLDGERVEGHMWNRLESGVEVDLTRAQFKRGEVIGEPAARQRTAAIARPDTSSLPSVRVPRTLRPRANAASPVGSGLARPRPTVTAQDACGRAGRASSP